MSTDYWVTRFVFQRLLAGIYLVGFLVVVNQFVPLCGTKGLLPISEAFRRSTVWESPSIFWAKSSDSFFLIMGWAGVALSLFALSGRSEAYGIWVSVLTWAILWLLYLSYVNVGQTFYGFGWETLLLEAGFLTIFLGSSDTKVPVIVIWLFRWLLFRLMFGAGMIKIRGDICWRDLTCMFFHYETQPMPNPLSWYFHHAPKSLHKFAVIVNHVTELIVPFGYFIKGSIAAFAGVITIIFQLLLIISGNFSWLNYITVVLSICCLNDSFLSFIPIRPPAELSDFAVHRYAVRTVAVVIAILSLKPALNLVSRRQLMNASFEPFHIVNTYGAFGSITKTRDEIIVEGSNSLDDESSWKEYQFKGKPGDIFLTPPVVAPYHLRLDWMMWFAAFSRCEQNPWFIRFLERVLEGDQQVLGLIKYNPFEDSPPQYLRSTLYRYQFTTPEEKLATGAIWKRTKVREYCPTFSLGKK